jgi:hypothetical protein
MKPENRLKNPGFVKKYGITLGRLFPGIKEKLMVFYS